MFLSTRSTSHDTFDTALCAETAAASYLTYKHRLLQQANTDTHTHIWGTWLVWTGPSHNWELALAVLNQWIPWTLGLLDLKLERWEWWYRVLDTQKAEAEWHCDWRGLHPIVGRPTPACFFSHIEVIIKNERDRFDQKWDPAFKHVTTSKMPWQVDMISDKPKCGYSGTPDCRRRYIKEMAFCILIAFRSLMTSATLISTVSNLMAGLSKIKEDEHLGPHLEFGCVRFQELFQSSSWVHVAILSDVFIQVNFWATLFDPRNTEFRLLRCYLKQNEIPQPLSQKVTQFLQHQYSCRVARTFTQAFLWRTRSFHIRWFHEHPEALDKSWKNKHIWFIIQTRAEYKPQWMH